MSIMLSKYQRVCPSRSLATTKSYVLDNWPKNSKVFFLFQSLKIQLFIELHKSITKSSLLLITFFSDVLGFFNYHECSFHLSSVLFQGNINLSIMAVKLPNLGQRIIFGYRLLCFVRVFMLAPKKTGAFISFGKITDWYENGKNVLTWDSLHKIKSSVAVTNYLHWTEKYKLYRHVTLKFRTKSLHFSGVCL